MKKLSTLITIFILTITLSIAQKNTIENGAHYEATISTSEGSFTVKLHNETPIHRDNFVKLANSNFYKGIIFHRVIKGFMSQAGDPSSREASQVKTYGEHDAGYKLPAEIVPQYFHKKGVLAAARESNNVNPNRESSSSQFYVVTGSILTDSTKSTIEAKTKERGSLAMTPEREKVYRTVGGAPHLDGSNTIFGEVVRGQKVVDKINAAPTYRNDRPKEDIYIKKITLKTVKDKR